jgi:hypothetical protein
MTQKQILIGTKYQLESDFNELHRELLVDLTNLIIHANHITAKHEPLKLNAAAIKTSALRVSDLAEQMKTINSKLADVLKELE